MAYFFRFNPGGTAGIRITGVVSQHIFYFKLRSDLPDYAGSILYIYDGKQDSSGMSVFRYSSDQITSSDVIDVYINGTLQPERNDLLNANAGDTVGIGNLTAPDFNEIYFGSRDDLTGRYEGLEIEQLSIDENGTIHTFNFNGDNEVKSDTGDLTLEVINPEQGNAQWVYYDDGTAGNEAPVDGPIRPSIRPAIRSCIRSAIKSSIN